MLIAGSILSSSGTKASPSKDSASSSFKESASTSSAVSVSTGTGPTARGAASLEGNSSGAEMVRMGMSPRGETMESSSGGSSLVPSGTGERLWLSGTTATTAELEAIASNFCTSSSTRPGESRVTPEASSALSKLSVTATAATPGTRIVGVGLDSAAKPVSRVSKAPVSMNSALSSSRPALAISIAGSSWIVSMVMGSTSSTTSLGSIAECNSIDGAFSSRIGSDVFCAATAPATMGVITMGSMSSMTETGTLGSVVGIISSNDSFSSES
mmetsp:Transcript_19979/g.32774  ORF Transcript_19979/g.32774 Transcript_19979/m.32774 type:complete len:270 (-) Transcript_19979:1646-2455(-)